MKLIKSMFFFFVFFVFGCSAQDDIERPWITIFVHGNFGAQWIALDFNNVLNDNYKGTSYQVWQNWFRLHTVTHKITYKKIRKPRFYPAFGLHKIELFNREEKNSDVISYAIAKTYQEVTAIIDPHQADNTVYYSFGWDGILSQTARRQAAIVFYQELSQEVARYKAQGINPKIRIACHSHGGNVALNLAGIYAVLNKEHVKDISTRETISKISQEISQTTGLLTLDRELCVDELIILATPIQKETEGLAASKFFKKVLTGYSHNDIVQIMDVISTDGPLSKRTIDWQKLGKNTISIQYSVVNNRLPAKNKPIIAFIKKYFHSHVRIDQIIEIMAQYVKIPEGKEFDREALVAEIQNIFLNMRLHPYDPMHGDFFNGLCNKKELIADKLPLLVWTPLICHLLAQYDCLGALHVTFNYYEQALTVVAQADNVTTSIDISGEKLLNFKKNFFEYLIT